jgi:peptide-methionine (R)-S-oxide reductase
VVSKSKKTDAEWQEVLTDDQFRVMRTRGTEPPFSGEYNDNKEAGEYLCAGCSLPLFSSVDKFNSGTGWPSFTAPSSETSIATDADTSLSMERTEALCANCDAHLGHIFPDGPEPTGMRYCINSVSLKFVKSE